MKWCLLGETCIFRVSVELETSCRLFMQLINESKTLQRIFLVCYPGKAEMNGLITTGAVGGILCRVDCPRRGGISGWGGGEGVLKEFRVGGYMCITPPPRSLHLPYITN